MTPSVAAPCTPTPVTPLASLVCRHSDLLLSQITRRSKFVLDIVLSVPFFLAIPGLSYALFTSKCTTVLEVYHHPSICKTCRNLDNGFQFRQRIFGEKILPDLLVSHFIFACYSDEYTRHLLGCAASPIFTARPHCSQCRALY